MPLKTILVNEDRYFSFEHDDVANKYYLTIPLSNRRIDYEEHYEIPKTIVDQYPENIDEVEIFVRSCRLGQQFHLSRKKIAPERGNPMWPSEKS